MRIRKISTAFAFTLLSTVSTALYAGPPASVEDLSWMTGNWAGALGPNQLEENWTAPEGSSIAAVVRMTGDDATSMFEMITIEEVDGIPGIVFISSLLVLALYALTSS